MQAQPTQDVTALLQAWTGGDENALDRLLPVLYAELHRTARAYMRRERSGHTLQTTALVNEVFLRLVDIHQVQYRDRVHFLTLAAQLMRRILVDHARRRGYLKRGGGEQPFPLDALAIVSPGSSPRFVAVDDALNALAKRDARKAKVVEMRFFGGLSVEETAAALDVSTQTVLRDWSLAKAWLRREMTQAGYE
ncbi:MAG: sigma-70 family RNA polymerase sigma factor [Acidobacteriia bacterium]|nr:sigma-70 family RNA polymerase sigma factor [Terriglobia bacterium]